MILPLKPRRIHSMNTLMSMSGSNLLGLSPAVARSGRQSPALRQLRTADLEDPFASVQTTPNIPNPPAVTSSAPQVAQSEAKASADGNQMGTPKPVLTPSAQHPGVAKPPRYPATPRSVEGTSVIPSAPTTLSSTPPPAWMGPLMEAVGKVVTALDDVNNRVCC